MGLFCIAQVILSVHFICFSIYSLQLAMLLTPLFPGNVNDERADGLLPKL